MDPSAIKGKKATVIGGARSGLAVARLLAGAGAQVFLTEKGEPTRGLEEALREAGIAFEFGGHTRRALEADFLAISPGVPSTVNIVQQAVRSGLQVFSEIEVASWFCRAPIVAITGSNGKTTTTSLIGHIFRRAGRKAVVAGNIGFPFSDYVRDLSPEAVVVLEVSSFQLDHIDTFRPRVSVLLNITPDHLDRYNYDFNQYAQSKYRIFENQRDDDVLVYNHDDALVREYVAWVTTQRALRAIGFSYEDALDEGAFLRDDRIVFRINQQEEILMEAQKLALRGRHNLHNSLAAAIAARVMEVRSDVVRESLTSFEGVPHRLEFVREVDGVRYVNDSKATNVNAVWYALESFTEPIVLIAGGRDKGNDYSSLKPLVRRKVRAVIALGESADKVINDLGALADQQAHAASMEEAIRYAHVFAEPGDVVLLSPACSSFDMFDNYEHRGDTFKRLVMSL
jgi:UDP-N-acetylmuramoylalanine--D-glutamate ligase